jgi:gliding motility-associated-like protein
LLPTYPAPQLNNTYQGLTSQVYTVVVTDVLACSVTQNFLLTQPLPLVFSEFTVTPENCIGNKDGTIIVEASGGNFFYRYFVAPGVRANRTGIFGNFEAGIYTVTVIDTLGCRTDSVVNLPLSTTPMILNSIKSDITNCFGFGNEGAITVNVSGGAGPFTYLWNTVPALTTNTISNLIAGYYEVQVVDINGCVAYDTIIIESAPCCDSVWFPNAFTPNNDNTNDEFRAVTGAGIEVLEFRITDRWGNIVFNSRGNNTGRYSGWDGTFKETGIPASADTYVYYYKYTCESDGKTYIVKGDIELIR